MADLVPAAANAAPPPAPAFDLAALNTGTPLERLRGLTAQPAVRRALPLFGGLAALGGVALTWALLSTPPQRVLYSQLDDATRAEVVASLDKAGIGYQIDNQTGTLTVDEDQLYRARMLVASDGALAQPDAQSSLDNLPLGASRTLEGERLRAAREREMQLTIQEIDGVESVRVHLAEAARSVFVREDTPPSASVMVRMAKGRQLSDSQVAAIVNLVAGSVPGMTPDAVRVVDQHGRLLSQRGGADTDRLELQGRMEEKLRGQLDGLLTPMLGAGNFSSEIQVDLDMDQVTSARESYDKEGVLRSETQAASQTTGPGQAGGVPGAVSNTPPAATVARPGAPQGTPPAAAGGAQPTNGESSATRNYELGREVSVANAGPGKVKRVSVAVAISQAAMKNGKPADLDQIKQLVSAAVGADPQRGDQVTVLARPFEPVDDQGVPFYEAPWFAMAVRYGVALLAVLLVLLLGVRPLVKALKREPAPALPAAADGEMDGEPGDGGEGETGQPRAGSGAAPDPAVLGRQVSLAQRIVEEKPDDALHALRQMLAQQNEAEAAR
ncbi:flagellar basal-body MS-ring/collar protein FliF [Novosphingobium sp.]|uniref:flagellar basal-body MS-ring/collar protein FliF n=1 Tax=Novosphingobium sp. TaxID=1874826 RepID=UPI0035AF0E8E